MTDESAATDVLTRINAAASVSTPGGARRAQHSKHHGIVQATFAVRDDVPADLRAGLFAQPASYPAYIRFSNGRQSDDRNADAHGMAIKLLSVPGAKLLPGREGLSAQDFILMDCETFFTGDLSDYQAINRGMIAPNTSVLDKVKFGAWVLFHLPVLKRILAMVSKKPTSPLTNTYYSTTPCSIGKLPVKWLAQPVSTRPAVAITTVNGLAESLARDLSTEPFVYDFGVDVQINPALQPVEDCTVPWSQAPGARRVWLARITIAAQPVNATAPLAEAIAYSPWHGLAEHQPLGAINRVRRPIYQVLSVRRHDLNGVTPSDTSELPDGHVQ